MTKFHAPAATRTYDVLVLGSQVAGAVAGALLARRGYRVLAVEHAPRATGYLDGPYRLPLGPNVLPLLRNLPAANAVFEELGLGPEVARAAEPLATLQILSERARLDLFSQTDRRTTEIARELGPKGDRLAKAIDSLIAREEHNAPFFDGSLPLPAENFRARWKQRSRSVGLQLGDAAPLVSPIEHPLARGLKELWRLSNNLVEQESLPEPKLVDQPARAALRPLAQWLRGLTRFPGGEAGLAALLRQRITAAGGQVLSGESAVIEELEVERGRIAAVKLLDSDNRYRAESVIAALDTDALRELVPAGARGGQKAKTLDAVRTRSQLLTLNLVVARAGLPPGLGDVAVGVPPGMGRTFFLQVGPVERVSAERSPAGGGERLITLTLQVPPQNLGAGADSVRKLLGELRRDSELFLPFLARHVLHESSPQLALSDPSGTQRRQHARMEIARPRQLGVTGLPPRALFRNVVLANQEVLPGLGLEGQFLSGLGAAALVQHMVKRANPLA